MKLNLFKTIYIIFIISFIIVILEHTLDISIPNIISILYDHLEFYYEYSKLVVIKIKNNTIQWLAEWLSEAGDVLRNPEDSHSSNNTMSEQKWVEKLKAKVTNEETGTIETNYIKYTAIAITSIVIISVVLYNWDYFISLWPGLGNNNPQPPSVTIDSIRMSSNVEYYWNKTLEGQQLINRFMIDPNIKGAYEAYLQGARPGEALTRLLDLTQPKEGVPIEVMNQAKMKLMIHYKTTFNGFSEFQKLALSHFT